MRLDLGSCARRMEQQADATEAMYSPADAEVVDLVRGSVLVVFAVAYHIS